MRRHDSTLRMSCAIAATALAVAACGGGGSYGDDDPQPANSAPTISSIGNRTIDQDLTDSGLSFTVSDGETAAGGLVVTASSSDETLLPASSLVLGGGGGSRTLTMTPVENALGTSIVTITVSDGQASTTRTFNWTVNPVLRSYTTYTQDTFAVTEDDVARTFVGFTLDSDADELDAPFDALLQ